MRAVAVFSVFVLLCGAAFVSADHRIVGGSVTTIQQYPFAAALLRGNNLVNFIQDCGGTILNSRSILSAAHCFIGQSANAWRVRVGSTTANSGGSVHQVQQIINHPNYNTWSQDSDISVLRLSTTLSFSNSVRAGSIAGSNYNLADNQAVWAIGWGVTSFGGQPSEQLRHVQIWTVNFNTCNSRYGNTLTANMLCSGWLDVGGRDQCTGDSGGPLIHNGVVVGVCSFGNGCATPRFPGVNTRVSRFTSWIQNNS